MASYDTLEYDLLERSLAAWGIALQSCVLRRGNLKADVLTITIPGANIGDDPVFPYDAQIILRQNCASTTGADGSFTGGTIRFQGKRVKNPLKATGRWQGVTYEFQGPWHDLEITQYVQDYKGATTNTQPGEVVLNTAAYPQISTSGLRFISVGDQIQCILQFVLDGYAAQGLSAPFQYVGRDLNSGAIDLDVTGTGPVGENTDADGNVYNKSVNAGTTIDVNLFKLFLKSEIIRPMSATQCLQKLLEWSPRTNLAFDYSTTPPTVYLQNIDGASSVNLPLFDGTNHKSIDLQRRDDLVPATVIVNYRITATIGGTSQTDVKKDKYGPHGSNSASDPDTGPAVVIITLDLQGESVSFATGQLDCEPLACIGGTHAARRAWWASRRGGEMARLEDYRVRFQDETGAATSIPNAQIFYTENGVDSTGAAVVAGQEFTAADYSFFVNRLVRGTQHAWMTLADTTPVKSVRAKITAPMQFAEYDSNSASGSPETDTTGNVIRRHNATDQQHCNIELTNGVTGPYSTDASSTGGEAYLLGAGGIAQYLWNMLSTLQYEGEFVKIEQTFGSVISLLNRANLTGGRAEWTTMGAQIQEVAENFGTHETSVKIGIAKHLSADQLSALLNMGRFRRTWYNALLRSDNTVAIGGAIPMPVTAGQSNTVEGLQVPQQYCSVNWSVAPTGTTPGTIGGQVNCDANQVKTILGGITPTPFGAATSTTIKQVQPRQVAMCAADGTVIQAIILASDFFTV